MRSFLRTLRYEGGYLLLLGLQSLAVRLSNHGRIVVGKWLGHFAFSFLRTERQRALEHLAIAFPEKTAEERIRIACASFENLGKGAMETLAIPYMSRENLIVHCLNPEALDGLAQGHAEGKRFVVVTGHLGNWEFLGALAASLLPFPVHTLARRLQYPRYDQAIRALRASHGLRTIYADESPRVILQLLRKGYPITFLADQDLPDHDGVWVDFFGRPAYTPTAPTALARSGHATIFVLALFREGKYFRLWVEGPLEVERTSDRKADLIRGTSQWTAILEKMIRRYPEQWVWMHRRWRTTPERLERHRARMQRRNDENYLDS